MKLSYLLKQPDFLLVTLLFLVSSTTSVMLYQRVLKETRRGGLFSEPLRIGAHGYQILSNRRCVGSFTNKLVDDGKTLSFTSEGLVRMKVQGMPLNAKLSAQASFNLLGQLGGSIVDVQTENFSIRIGTVNIDPLRIIIKGKVGAGDFKHEFAVPGPIELRRVGLSSYLLRHARFEALNVAHVEPVLGFLRGQLQFTVVPAGASSLACDDQTARLDLDSLVATVKTGFGGLSSLLAGL